MMTVNALSETSNFSTETNFDYNISNGQTTENNKRKVKNVENASITNSETTATTQEYTFTDKYYNLNVSQEQLANKSFKGIIYASKKGCISKETLIPFSFDGTTYYAKKGITWKEWINSNLYEKNFGSIISNGTVTKNGLQVFDRTEYVIGKNISGNNISNTYNKYGVSQQKRLTLSKISIVSFCEIFGADNFTKQ